MIVPIQYDHFGYKHGDVTDGGKRHPGHDLNAGPRGDSDKDMPVKACADGEVVFALPGIKGWGKVVVIHHPIQKVWTRYGHLLDMNVKVGQIVKEGEVIGSVGNGEGIYSYHLHFDMPIKEFRNWGDYSLNNTFEGLKANYVDPLVFIKNWNKKEQEKKASPLIEWHIKNKMIEKWSDNPTECEIAHGWLAYKILQAVKEDRIKDMEFNL